MKNSATTNVLFLDEILENIDVDGFELLMNLIKDKMKHKNVFVISQRYEEFKDYFRSEIIFGKGEDGFTCIN
jgi:ABC-type multidrug transport system ATPase subunit